MIEKEEIERISIFKKIDKKIIEKDYLLEVLLFVIYHEIGKKIFFKGGTALYKLHSLNRFSEDLDFTLGSSKIKIDKLSKKIIAKLNDNGISGRIKEISDYKNQKNIRLELKGPLFDGNPNTLSLLVINISLKERPIYKPEQRKIFSQYLDIPSFDVFVMPLNELLAEKIRALLTRDKARDMYDVWFLLKKGIKFEIKDVNKKLKLYGERFDQRRLKEKLEEKEKTWQMDLNGLIIGQLPDFKDVKSYILNLIKA